MLEVHNQGVGFIGEIGSDWHISQNGSPAILGDQSGRLGSLTFSAGCDGTSKFTIDNYLSVKHFFDNQTDRWLSTFDGYIRAVETNGTTGRFTMASLLSRLDVERTASPDVSGTFQRTMTIPAGESYEILGTTYYLGGSWQTIGGVNTFVKKPIPIYDVAAVKDYTYVLCAGGHAGEVIVRLELGGQFSAVWPVYSDATDLATPNSRYITIEDDNIWIAQVSADRVKQFKLAGTFVTQWGSAGTGSGQFDTISGVAVSESFNAIYVLDSALGRFQQFSEAGVWQATVGTSGTGAGNTVFNQPNGIAVDPILGTVMVSDRNARIRAYTAGGSYVTQVAGSYDFATAQSTGEFTHGAAPIRMAFDQLGNLYALQSGKMFKYVKPNTGTWLGASWQPTGVPIRTYETEGINDPIAPNQIGSSHHSGILFVARTEDHIDQYAGSLGTLQAHWLYYVALAAPNLPIRILALAKEFTVGELNYVGWRGNVWQHLCDLCATTGNAMIAFDDHVFLLNRAGRSYRLPLDARIDPVRIDSRATGRSVQVVNHRSRHTVGKEILYSAAKDNNRTFSIEVNGFSYVNVSQDTYAEFVDNPIPAFQLLENGWYTIIDDNEVLMDPTVWTYWGGKIMASIGEKPGSIDLVIAGPRYEIPGYQSPYKIATVEGNASLTVIGSGVIADPEVISIGTGVSEDVSSREVGQTIDSPFVHNSEVAYSEGSWAAYNMGTPNQRFTISFRVNHTLPWVNSAAAGIAGTGALVGHLVEHDDAQYIVETVDYNAATITLGVYRYTKQGWDFEVGVGTSVRPEAIWGGKTAAEFDAFWLGYTAQDFTIAPMRNPYGV